MGDSLRKGTVVGHQQQALAVLIEAAHRVQTGRDIADQLHHRLAAQLIAGGGDIAAGLVQGQIVELLVLLDVDALIVHMEHIPVGVHLVAHLDGVAVDLDAALGDDLLGGAAGAQALLCHDFLNAFFCHLFLLCAPPGAQKRTRPKQRGARGFTAAVCRSIDLFTVQRSSLRGRQAPLRPSC